MNSSSPRKKSSKRNSALLSRSSPCSKSKTSSRIHSCVHSQNRKSRAHLRIPIRSQIRNLIQSQEGKSPLGSIVRQEAKNLRWSSRSQKVSNRFSRIRLWISGKKKFILPVMIIQYSVRPIDIEPIVRLDKAYTESSWETSQPKHKTTQKSKY